MNYRHLFHAGNFADVLKHTILIGLLQYLAKKETPFCYLETHAGRGLYDLQLLDNKPNKEYLLGVEKVMQFMDSQHACVLSILEQYRQIVSINNYPHYYPGSPLIAQSCLRSIDQMILMELHPEEYQALKCFYNRYNQNGEDSKNPKVAIHQQDGYLGLKAFLPPKEKRGLILIDPPFEKKEEWQHIIEALMIAEKRFANGIYAIWYPIKDQQTVYEFKEKLKNQFSKSLLEAELILYPPDAKLNLIGSGVCILNPPWQFELLAKPLLQQLWQILSWQGAGSYTCNLWLKE